MTILWQFDEKHPKQVSALGTESWAKVQTSLRDSFCIRFSRPPFNPREGASCAKCLPETDSE
jgi:hypothetical protein